MFNGWSSPRQIFPWGRPTSQLGARSLALAGKALALIATERSSRRRTARLALLPPAFGDQPPQEVFRCQRFALFCATKEMPGSITQISERLHRDRRAVKRDVDELARAGLVPSRSPAILPGAPRLQKPWRRAVWMALA